MGFRLEPKIYNLTFEDDDTVQGDGDPLNVKVRNMTINDFKKIMKLVDLKDGLESIDMNDLSSEQMDPIIELFDFLEDLIVTWNVEDSNGVPIKSDSEGIGGLGLDFAFTLLIKAFDAIVGVSLPLEKPSEDGEQMEAELEIPMERLTK